MPYVFAESVKLLTRTGTSVKNNLSYEQDCATSQAVDWYMYISKPVDCSRNICGINKINALWLVDQSRCWLVYEHHSIWWLVKFVSHIIMIMPYALLNKSSCWLVHAQQSTFLLVKVHLSYKQDYALCFDEPVKLLIGTCPTVNLFTSKGTFIL